MHNKPSDFRVEQLGDAWTEGERFTPLQLRGNDPSLAPFATTVKNATGTFERKPEFFHTVFLGGEGKLKEEAEVVRREQEDWARRVVVADPVIRTTLPQRRSKPAQTDRVSHILKVCH